VSAVKPAMLAAWLKPAPSPVAFTGNPNFQRPGNIKFPAPAAVPTVGQMRSLRDALMRVHADHSDRPMVVSLNDDWRTRGNWIDNYGNMYAHLFSMVGNSLLGGYCAYKFFPALTWINRKWRPGDAARHWRVGGIHNSTVTRTLQDPQFGGRTDANTDDHGETYRSTVDGPNLYWTCELPAGHYIFSIYLLNDDAHSGDVNRRRDYLVQVSDTPVRSQTALIKIGEPGVNPVQWFRAARPTAVARCSYFWGGVYKRFFIDVQPCLTGKFGTKYGVVTVCVHRNYSLNAIIEGAFFDAVGKAPRPVARVKGAVSLRYWPKIPAFRLGQPSFPTILGFPQGRLPPTCKAVGMPSRGMVALDCMQQLLHLREASAVWYAAIASPAIVVLTRYIAAPQPHGPPLGAYLSQRAWCLVGSRRTLASLERTVPAPLLSNRVYFRPGRLLGYAWWYMKKHGIASRPNEQGERFDKAFFKWTKRGMRKEIKWKIER